MTSQSGMGSHGMAYGILFTVIAVLALIALILFRSQAVDPTAQQSTTAGNTTPAVDSVKTSLVSLSSVAGDQVSDTAPLALTENGTKTLYIHGIASDANGCEEIADFPNLTGQQNATRGYVMVSRGNATCIPTQNSTSRVWESTTDNNHCYFTNLTTANFNITGTTDGCTAATASDTTVQYQASFNIQFFADPTDTGSDYAAERWGASVLITDANNASSAASAIAPFELSSLAAFSVLAPDSGAIAYGTLALGAFSADKLLVFTNTGNRNVHTNVQVNGDMDCTYVGSSDIPAANVKIATSTITTGATNPDGTTNLFSPSATTASENATFKLLATAAKQVDLINEATKTKTSLKRQGQNASQGVGDATAETKDLHVRMVMPTTGVQGACSNTITFTPVVTI